MYLFLVSFGRSEGRIIKKIPLQNKIKHSNLSNPTCNYVNKLNLYLTLIITSMCINL
jgi:hypothetical protein